MAVNDGEARLADLRKGEDKVAWERPRPFPGSSLLVRPRPGCHSQG